MQSRGSQAPSAVVAVPGGASAGRAGPLCTGTRRCTSRQSRAPPPALTAQLHDCHTSGWLQGLCTANRKLVTGSEAKSARVFFVSGGKQQPGQRQRGACGRPSPRLMVGKPAGLPRGSVCTKCSTLASADLVAGLFFFFLNFLKPCLIISRTLQCSEYRRTALGRAD